MQSEVICGLIIYECDDGSSSGHSMYIIKFVSTSHHANYTMKYLTTRQISHCYYITHLALAMSEKCWQHGMKSTKLLSLRLADRSRDLPTDRHFRHWQTKISSGETASDAFHH